MTPAQRQLLGARQAIRLHIESMNITRDALRQRAKHHKQDPLSYKIAHRAVSWMDRKIAKAKQELQVLEERWKF